MRSKFMFGSKSTEDFQMHIEKFPSLTGAVRRRQTVTVAGRNGNLHFVEEAFENYTQSYECYYHGRLNTLEQAHAIKAWLTGTGAYQRLQDTYDPDHYRLATFSGPLNVENHLNKYGRCTVSFDCDPRSFLLSGDQRCTFTADGTLQNPTAFKAQPIITIYGSGSGTVTVGDATVQIHTIVDQIILDCEIQNAYRQVGDGAPENYNGNIYAPEFPALLPGANPVSFSGDITEIEIIPRWWEL